MPNTQSHVVKKKNHHHESAVRTRAIDVVSGAASAAGEARSRVQTLVTNHPLVSAGAMLGAGLILGVVAHKLLSHTQTFSEAFADRIGLNRVRDRFR